MKANQTPISLVLVNYQDDNFLWQNKNQFIYYL